TPSGPRGQDLRAPRNVEVETSARERRRPFRRGSPSARPADAKSTPPVRRPDPTHPQPLLRARRSRRARGVHEPMASKGVNRAAPHVVPPRKKLAVSFYDTHSHLADSGLGVRAPWGIFMTDDAPDRAEAAEVVLEIGGKGGSLTIEGIRAADDWRASVSLLSSDQA